MSTPDHPTELPTPAASARAHSARVCAHIRDVISREGPVTFERFMDLALYAPGLGYYSAGAQKFGAAGDFITAPELSPAFSQVVARQWMELLRTCGGDTILELGAGSGALAEHALKTLHAEGANLAAYWILEPSADLRERQQTRLKDALPEAVFARVRWLNTLPDTPFNGIVFGNEVLDALPVARFVKTDTGIMELGVEALADGFDWCELPAREALTQAVADIEDERGAAFASGYRSEVHLSLRGFVASLAECLNQGAVMMIDYGHGRGGYYLGERTDGTLRCHYRHRAHNNPFFYPGLQDITAHVDFSALADAGNACGLELAGFSTQAHFLLGGGLETIVRASDPEDTRNHLTLTQQVKTLTSPQDMGEQFKVMLLEKGIDSELSGFDLRDLSYQL